MEKSYFAGGCFWGMEHYMAQIPGVLTVQSGYANSLVANPSYEDVCSGNTQARETVEVTYNPSILSLVTLCFAFFEVIDPTVSNQQGHDRGAQYQTGLYYTNPSQQKTMEAVWSVMRKRFVPFCVECKPLDNFYLAEDYHQDYLVKNPQGYCHVSLGAFEKAKKIQVDAGRYFQTQYDLSSLTPLQKQVTQEEGTEAPFTNAYWDTTEKGIYVDVVTGEPLFTSFDKFPSSCGWPAFSAPLDPNVVVEHTDLSHGMVRTEIKSRLGYSHLGHVFDQDAESPTGIRYCIDSAALRFIPYEHLEEEGYGDLLPLFDKTK